MRDKPKVFKGNIPWCRIEDFDGKYLSDSKSNQYVDQEIINSMNLKIHPKETLLVSCSADLGRCAIVKAPLISNQTFIGLVFNKHVADNEFFYYYMTFYSEELNNLSSGTTILYLSREQFENFKVIIPPTKEEQTAIVQVLSDMDAEIEALERKLAKYRLIKQGMMQELLTGKKRLI
jgi:type I restriction enzyme S subunit